MVKWPSLVLNKAGKANKKPLILGIIILLFLAVLAWVGYLFNESLPEVPRELFESLIQVIAMLFGFTLIVIFYYQGKIHEHKKDTLHAFLDFIETQDEMFTIETKYVKALKGVVNLMPPAILRGWFSRTPEDNNKGTNAKTGDST